MTVEELEFKKKELERLLKEEKIDVNEYLDAVAKLEKREGVSEVKLQKPEEKSFTLLKTDFLLMVSPFLLLAGWLLVNLNPVEAYTYSHSQYIPGMSGYPYSPIGLAIMMCAIVLLSVGITSRWVKSISRGEFIALEAIGWSILVFAAYLLVNSFSVVWVQAGPYSWKNFLSIDPASCNFFLLIWFIGIFTVTYGLAPLRKWFSKSIA
ncbi:MAG: hypothetical protein QXX08_10500 [Candidatus Bathyarchaeia archaeon]